MSSFELILASASPARCKVLSDAGIHPQIVPAHLDEEALLQSLHPHTEPVSKVQFLAEAKAQAIADTHKKPHTIIIGCDSMLSFNGELLGKPYTAERAIARWHAMSGKTANLLTGHAVILIDEHMQMHKASDTSSTAVSFGTPTQAELEAYIATEEPLEVAGAFTLDARGGWFIDKIEGDPSSVIGISLPLTRRLLHKLGVSVDMIWSSVK